MRLADYIADFLAQHTEHVYGVCGGAAMYLNDAIAHHPKLKWIATHHEQAATFAAEAAARVSGRIGVVHVTAGPGVTNTVTGVACAWADSLPLMVIAGQVGTSTLKGSRGRQLGISEVDGVKLMGPITKYSVCVRYPDAVRYYLESALHEATTGRPGPVYVEVPLDIQNAEIDPDELKGYEPFTTLPPKLRPDALAACVKMVREAQRPVLLLGNGVRLSGAEAECQKLLELGIPILTSWSASDLVDSNHPCYIGRPGLIGDRAGNFAVQSADLVLAIGSRLSIPQIGHNWELFAPHAKIVMVDIDPGELAKKTLRLAKGIVADAKEFINEFSEMMLLRGANQWPEWMRRCFRWAQRYPAIDPAYADVKDGVHSYHFLKLLAQAASPDAIIVTDVGTSFVSTMQAMPMTGYQRLFHSPGIAPMGYGLPAAVGAAFAGHGRQVICLTGDGGTMFNLQELQTIVHHKLPIKIFLYANHGYKTMQVTQGTHFRRESVASPESDVSWPDFSRLADAFGIWSTSCFSHADVEACLPSMLASDEPEVCVLNLSRSQTIAPLVKTKTENGQFVPVAIEDMWPYLPREEFEENMRCG